jgi:Rieske Fe-S protein
MSALLSACKTPLGVVRTTAANHIVTIPIAAFADSDYKLVRVNNYNYDLAIQKKTNGTYLVLVMMCTHAAQPLTKTGDKYYCTLHGSQFSHEGVVMKGPAEKDMMQLNAEVNHENLIIHLNRNI